MSVEIFEDCRTSKLHVKNLFIKVNNLIFQAQQFIDRIEEKEKLKAEEKYQAEVSKPVERVNSQNQIDRDHYQIIYLVVILSFMSFVG